MHHITEYCRQCGCPIYVELKIGNTDLTDNEDGRPVRKMVEWVYAQRNTPPELHDAAAKYLDVPSLCHGFADDLLENVWPCKPSEADQRWDGNSWKPIEGKVMRIVKSQDEAECWNHRRRRPSSS